MTDYRHDLELAKEAARLAGATVLRHFGRQLKVTHKQPDQPLTEADLAADALLRDLLTTARPDYGWLSEETEDSPDRMERKRVWIVDPIDGTRSFIAGRPEFAVSIGLAEDGEAVAGVIYNPASRELFYAALGAGAFVQIDGAAQRLQVGTRGADDDVTLLASRSEIGAGALAPFTAGWHVAGVGSTAYKMARVAWGRGDVFLSRGPKQEWDVCAGALILREAGGRATDVHGSPPRFNRRNTAVDGMVAANPALHDAVLGRLRDTASARTNGAGKAG